MDHTSFKKLAYNRAYQPRRADPEAAYNVQIWFSITAAFGRAARYGIYDLATDAGWGSVGIDHNTAAFAVQTIRAWWHVGKVRYHVADA